MPNEIVIEAMIKGLRPGPTTQYFARKPPQTLEKLLQKMDEYIRADNDFRQKREEAYMYSEMTRASEEDSIPGMSEQSTIPMPTTKGLTILRAVITAHNLRTCSKLLTDHQLREVEGGEASVEEGTVISLGNCSACSVARTRDTQQGRAKS